MYGCLDLLGGESGRQPLRKPLTLTFLGARDSSPCGIPHPCGRPSWPCWLCCSPHPSRDFFPPLLPPSFLPHLGFKAHTAKGAACRRGDAEARTEWAVPPPTPGRDESSLAS